MEQWQTGTDGQWNSGTVAQWNSGAVLGNDEVVRGARLRTDESCVEPPFQHLYPLELSYDRQLPTPVRMNTEVAPFRPRRNAAVTACLRLQEITQNGELSVVSH